ncbi:hypothetical protein HPB49_005417 [Dermacentor silvarum]|uniref:Uncharacterized protein n=1 Tax=Dermacentor silvarum TaxID=543639 RepID=A0ACB8DB67_DERSI|nr:hypothetical protein HPB49_005417 [Dermacentor silvarum]
MCSRATSCNNRLPIPRNTWRRQHRALRGCRRCVSRTSTTGELYGHVRTHLRPINDMKSTLAPAGNEFRHNGCQPIPGNGDRSSDSELPDDDGQELLPCRAPSALTEESSENEGDSEDEPPPATSTSRGKKGSAKCTPKWTNACLERDRKEIELTGSTVMPSTIKDLDTPFHFFKFVCPVQVFRVIREESLRYSIQCRPEKPLMVSVEELERAGKLHETKRAGRPCTEIESLIPAKKRTPLAQLPTADLRLYKIDHMPNWLDKRVRCRLPFCNHLTNVSCKKCNAALFFNRERNCFASLHYEDKMY